MSTVPEAIEQVRRAIEHAGPHPTYHRDVMRRHRSEWPVLWAALDALLLADRNPDVPCPQCDGAGELSRCVNDGTHGCSHTYDPVWPCSLCRGACEVPRRTAQAYLDELAEEAREEQEARERLAQPVPPPPASGDPWGPPPF